MGDKACIDPANEYPEEWACDTCFPRWATKCPGQDISTFSVCLQEVWCRDHAEHLCEHWKNQHCSKKASLPAVANESILQRAVTTKRQRGAASTTQPVAGEQEQAL